MSIYPVYYGIRHRVSGQWMPELKRGRGYSHWNPATEPGISGGLIAQVTGTPRLFPTQGAAFRAIGAWASLPNARRTVTLSFNGDEYDDIKTTDDGRQRADLQVVRVRIVPWEGATGVFTPDEEET